MKHVYQLKPLDGATLQGRMGPGFLKLNIKFFKGKNECIIQKPVFRSKKSGFL